MERQHDPLAGISPTGLAKHSAETRFGRLLRQADARHQLRRLDEQQSQHEQELARITAINGQLRQTAERARLSVQSMLEFGIALDVRQAYRELLLEIAMHGGLTLHEAASLAHARTRQQANNYRENGAAPSPPIGSVG